MKNKIKIHHVTLPKFTVNGEEYYVQSRMLKDFSEIDSLIEKELKRAETLGYNIELAIYSFTNVYDGKLVESIDGEQTALFMRYRFFKSDGDHLPISIKLQ